MLTVYLRHRQKVRRRPGSAADLAELTRRTGPAELEAERRRVLRNSVETVREFAKQHAIKVVDVDYRSRRILLRAALSEAEQAFETKLVHAHVDGVPCHRPTRRPKVPKSLTKIAHAVLGLDTRPPPPGRLRNHSGSNGVGGFYPSQIARFYGISSPGRGAGQRIALIEPAGGYDRADIEAACKAMSIPVPRITDIGVGNGRNGFGLNRDADKEVALDLQVIAGVAPEAQISVYFTELSEPALVAGVSQALHGSATPPDVIIVTWGEPEGLWPTDARLALDAVLRDAIRLGTTVVATAGDDLATERMNDGKVHVNYPASSPYVLGCGGTRITLDATQTSIIEEIVWKEGTRGTGGGISEYYAVPSFQGDVTLPVSLNNGSKGRGVPDVAAAAAAVNGYRIVIGGSELIASGTSAVAPLWGAFIALINEQRGQTLGFANPHLYENQQCFRAITSGDNKDFLSDLGYAAGEGWNACAGLGAPKGGAILAALSAVA
jgi:kumamolisin